MKTIVAVSDPHVDWMTYGRPRFEELAEALHRSVEVAIERQAALWCCLGDWCDPDSGSRVFRATKLLLDIAIRLTEADIPNVWLVGNHDVIEDGRGESVLEPLRSLQPYGGATLLSRPYSACSRVQRDLVEGMNFVALPFTPSSHPYDPEAFVRDIGGDYSGRPTLVLSHLTHVPGVVPGEENNEMARGRELSLPRAAIGECFPNAVILQGHYHKRQVLPAAEGLPMVQIVGSLAQLTHGEEDHDPGFVVVQLDV